MLATVLVRFKISLENTPECWRGRCHYSTELRAPISARTRLNLILNSHFAFPDVPVPTVDRPLYRRSSDDRSLAMVGAPVAGPEGPVTEDHLPVFSGALVRQPLTLS